MQSTPRAGSDKGQAPDAAVPLGLGAIIGIAVGATLVASVLLGILCLRASRKRSTRRQHAALSHQAEPVFIDDGDASSIGGPGRSPRKLRKRGGSTNTPERGLSPIKRVSLPVLPPVFPSSSSRRASFNFFGFGGSGSNSGSGGGASAEKGRRSETSPRRQNSTWIDEDAIHGPKIRKHSGKKSLRDSWPLRMMMGPPTLPRLNLNSLPLYSSHQQTDDSLVISGHQEDSVEVVPIRELPQPPRPALVIPSRPAPQQSPPRPFFYEEAEQARPAISGSFNSGDLRHAAATTRGRQASTDSTLQGILESTERRLQEGQMTGVARCNRQDTSPAKKAETSSRESLVGHIVASKRYEYTKESQEDDVPLAQLVANRNRQLRTPSPTKPSGKAQYVPTQGSLAPPSHGRQFSQSSDISEPDSMIGDATAIDINCEAATVTTRLTSPSRSPSRQPAQQALEGVEPPSGSVSSLSTLYSEDELAHENSTQATSLESSSVSGDWHKASVANIAPSLDPFVATPATPASASGTPVTVSLLGGIVGRPAGKGKLVLNCPPKLKSSSPVESSPTPVKRQSNADRALSPTSPNRQPHASTSSPIPKASDMSREELEELLETPTLRTRMRSGVLPAPVLLPATPSIDGDNGTENVPVQTKPEVMVTSPTTVSSTPNAPPNSSKRHNAASPSRLTSIRVVPPPLQLYADCERGSSPTLGEDDDYISVVAPSPFPSPRVNQEESSFSSNTSVRLVNSANQVLVPRAEENTRVVSVASSVYSQYVEDGARSVSPERQPHQPYPPCPPLPPTVVVAPSDAVEVNEAAVRTNADLLLPTVVAAPKVRREERSSLLSLSGDRIGLNFGEKYLMTNTIAELRRNNSQVSAYSSMSSRPSARGGRGNVLESPTIPALRGGGFGPSARPTGSRNYLALGTSSLDKKDGSGGGSNGRDNAAMVTPSSGGPDPARSASPSQPSANPVGQHQCSMKIWLGCTCSHSASTELHDAPTHRKPRQSHWEETGDDDGRLMQLKMPKADFVRYSSGFFPESSERFTADLGQNQDAGGASPNDLARRNMNGGNVERGSCHASRRASRLGIEASPDRRSVDSLGLYDQDGFLIGSPDRAQAVGAPRSRGLRI